MKVGEESEEEGRLIIEDGRGGEGESIVLKESMGACMIQRVFIQNVDVMNSPIK